MPAAQQAQRNRRCRSWPPPAKLRPPLPSQPSLAPHSSLSRDNTLRPPFPSVQHCLLALPVLSQPPQRLIRRWPADLPNAPPAADSFQRPKPSAPCLTARQFRLPTLPSSPTTSARAFRPTSPRPTQTAPGWSAICRASFPAASWSTRQHRPKIKTVHQPPDRLADRPLPLRPQIEAALAMLGRLVGGRDKCRVAAPRLWPPDGGRLLLAAAAAALCHLGCRRRRWSCAFSAFSHAAGFPFDNR